MPWRRKHRSRPEREKAELMNSRVTHNRSSSDKQEAAPDFHHQRFLCGRKRRVLVERVM